MNYLEQIIRQQQFIGQGVLPDKPDSRDINAEEVLAGVDVVIDWKKGYNALEDVGWPDMPNSHQETQFSCVGRAWAHYKQVLQCADTGEKVILSGKSVYNPIAHPGVGSYVRDGGMRTVNYGVNKESTVPSNGTEAQVTAPFDFSPYADEAAYFKNLRVASITSSDFDVLAKMIVLNKGFVSGFSSHCMYAKGFGMTAHGKRFILFHNSYGPGSDVYYYENADLPGLYSAWTAIDIKNLKMHPYNIPSVIRYGESGGNFKRLVSALGVMGWHITSKSYDRNAANVILNFQKANLSHTSVAFWYAIMYYRGTFVDQATVAHINYMLSHHV